MKFKAAILTEIKKPLEIVDLDIPKLKSGQLLVKIFYSSICGTQINEINGLKGEDKYLPHTLGHEGYGEVVEVSEDVHKVSVGDHVVVTWIKGAGLESENINYGKVSSGKACTLSEYSVVSENRVVPLSLAKPMWKYAPLLGCCVPTGAGTVENETKATSRVLVLGLGGVGVAACIWASLRCSSIYGYDISEYKKNILSTIDVTEYNNNRVDCVIDATGNIEAFNFGWEHLTKNGKFVVVGNPPKGTKFCVDPFDLIFGKSLVGSAGGAASPDSAIPFYAKHLGFFKKIPDREYPLEDINLAVSNWGRERKPIIRM
jgi:S-(hydroxymethyl)glutathione dehydrogenase/alcohol dehydrogenase